ncbi:MAG: histidinol-phosphate transaminase [Gammaproteobacteria bacterium]|nr:histidinol-phosphate transaminase [Gammaproteobacteria bacterium]
MSASAFSTDSASTDPATTDLAAIDFTALAKPGISELAPYQPGKPVEELQRESGVREAIKLASNENPLGPSPRAMAALRGRLNEVERYPDGGGYALKQALAAHLGIDHNRLTLGNGSNEVLELVARVFAGPGDEIIYSEHCFTVYPIATRIVGATAVQVKARRWGHDLQAMAGAVNERTRIVYIASPNNPTGTWVTDGELERFLAAVPPRVLVVLDEAYYEYARARSYPPASQYPDGMSKQDRFHNLLVTRTFSKVHGLAALRIGYCVSHPQIADLMNRIRMPFNVNAPGMTAALAALDDDAHIQRSLQCNYEGMEQLQAAFRSLDIPTIDSAGNFLTFDSLGEALPVYDGLLRLGVIVRPIGAYDMADHLRVTIGTHTENERFLTALREVMSGLGRL